MAEEELPFDERQVEAVRAAIRQERKSRKTLGRRRGEEEEEEQQQIQWQLRPLPLVEEGEDAEDNKRFELSETKAPLVQESDEVEPVEKPLIEDEFPETRSDPTWAEKGESND